MSRPPIAVVDTNILLLNAQNLFQLADIVIIPGTVIDELDSKKSVIGEIGYQAREFGRIIARGQSRITSTNGDLIETSMTIDDIVVIITECTNYPSFADSSSSIVNDRKIIHVATYYPNAVFISNDIMARIRAESVGLSTSEFVVVDMIEYEFIRYLVLDFNTFSTVHGKPVIDIDPSYQPYNYAYMLNCPETGYSKLALVQNGLLKVIGKDTEQQLREQLMPPVNSGQLILSALIQDQSADVTIVDAIAGSGKTIGAFSNAMKLVATNSPYEGIIYIRNSVDDYGSEDEKVGYLSGNDEKMAVYLHPYYDTLHTIAERHVRGKYKGQELLDKIAEQVDTYISKYNISAMIALGLRGRTFENSIIIIDEAQNISAATMQKILTRIGKNCKVIVIGSNKQIDSKFLTRFNNGLSILLHATSRTDLPIKINAATLEHVVRGRITEFAELIFAKRY
jgi:PhoH-like ATPase